MEIDVKRRNGRGVKLFHESLKRNALKVINRKGQKGECDGQER